MSSESRIWEIRPFGSMRGGSELVIGLRAFQSIRFRLLYRTEKLLRSLFPLFAPVEFLSRVFISLLLEESAG